MASAWATLVLKIPNSAARKIGERLRNLELQTADNNLVRLVMSMPSVCVGVALCTKSIGLLRDVFVCRTCSVEVSPTHNASNIGGSRSFWYPVDSVTSGGN